MDIILSKNSFSYLENQCAICMYFYHSDDIVSLVIHQFNGESEKQDSAVKRLHIFHSNCFKGLLNRRCPLDNCNIHKVRDFKYSHIIALNIINYSHDYYSLIKDMPPAISVTDVNNLNHPDYSGKTLLYCACQCNESKLINKLINCGADFNLSDSKGFTPLMILCSSNFHETLRNILRRQHILKEININAEDTYGFTAIDYAIKQNSWPCIQLLIDKFFNKLNESGKNRLFDEVKSITNKILNKPYNDIKFLIKSYFTDRIKSTVNMTDIIDHSILKNTEDSKDSKDIRNIKYKKIIKNYENISQIQPYTIDEEIEKLKSTDLYLKRPKIHRITNN